MNILTLYALYTPNINVTEVIQEVCKKKKKKMKTKFYL